LNPDEADVQCAGRAVFATIRERRAAWRDAIRLGSRSIEERTGTDKTSGYVAPLEGARKQHL